MSKGSTPRPLSVIKSLFDSNWDKIFKNIKPAAKKKAAKKKTAKK